MVRVKVFRETSGRVTGFTASGHAGFATKGSDIVCAAVSVLTQTAVLALPRHAGVTPKVSIDDDSGWLECQLPDTLSAIDGERAQVILETMVTGISEVAREYSDFVTLKEVVRR